MARLLFAFMITNAAIWACKTFRADEYDSLTKAYLDLRFSKVLCKLTAKDYFALASRAIVAQRYSEVHWMSKKAPIDSKFHNRIQILKSHALREMGRYEESITELKSILKRRTKEEESQKAHLLLIKAFYKKDNMTLSKNVKYLISLFNRRYPDSSLKTLLAKWRK